MPIAPLVGIEPCPPRRVLLAEDDAAMRALLACRLRRAGFEVVEAGNGTEALQRLAQGRIGSPGLAVDVVVSDVRMPGCDGINILASLQQTVPSVPVILITAFGTMATHVQAQRLGAYAIVDKPFDLEDLTALVREAARAVVRPSVPADPTNGLRINE
jgi:DNA-binding NtrC family response regulator